MTVHNRSIAAIRGALILLAALLFTQSFAGCETASSAPASEPFAVKVSPVTSTDGGRILRLSGTMSAERSIALSFSVPGIVEEVMVQEGRSVGKGDILATLVRSSYQDALGIAEASANQAEDAYRRFEPMYRNGTLPAVKMVDIETGRESARLSVSMARKKLDDTVLRAPASGVIANRNVEPGATAAPGLPAFTLVQTQTMMATAPVPETEIARLQRGMTADVVVPALRDTLRGTIREIAVTANPLTRTYDVKVAVPNPTGMLRIGMIANVHLRIDGEAHSIVVPPEAVRVDERSSRYVYVVDDGNTLRRREVDVTGFAAEGMMLSGNLREGELVVSSGTPMLSDGMTVRIADEQNEAER